LQIVYSVDVLGVVDSIDFGLDNVTKTFIRLSTDKRQTKIGTVL